MTEEPQDPTQQRLAALVALYLSGQILKGEFRPAVAAVIYRGKVIASRTADILISTLAGLPPLGVVPGPQHLDRLEEAVATVLEEEGRDDPQEAADGLSGRLVRLAEAEALTSRQKTLRAAIEGHGYPAYREHVADNACEICQPFANRLHDVAEDWTPHHPKCRCELVPVGTPKTQEEA